MIIRNKNFFSKMIMDEYKKSSEQEISIKWSNQTPKEL